MLPLGRLLARVLSFQIDWCRIPLFWLLLGLTLPLTRLWFRLSHIKMLSWVILPWVKMLSLKWRLLRTSMRSFRLCLSLQVSTSITRRLDPSMFVFWIKIWSAINKLYLPFKTKEMSTSLLFTTEKHMSKCVTHQIVMSKSNRSSTRDSKNIASWSRWATLPARSSQRENVSIQSSMLSKISKLWWYMKSTDNFNIKLLSVVS